MRFRLLLGFFFLSGVSGLIYEVLWMRKLSLLFGSTSVATSLTVAAFLGGLAGGAWALGRLADRFQRPALVYGLAEAAIGLYGLFSLEALEWAGVAHLRILEATAFSPALAPLLQLALVFGVLAIPTMLMGGTLPLLVSATGTVAVKAAAGKLYTANTAGAVLGCAAAGFLLMPNLGVGSSLRLACGLNLALAVGVGLVFRRPVAREGPACLDPEDLAERRPSWAVGLAAAACGFLVLYYEVIWTRCLELVVGTSTYAFTTMLVTFLMGLAVGAWAGTRLAQRGASTLGVFASSQLLTAVLVWLAAGWIPETHAVALAVHRQFHHSPVLYHLMTMLLGASVLLPAAVAMGIAFPLILETSRQSRRRGWNTGWLYALNTAGCLLGAGLAGLAVIPALGLQGSLRAGVVMNTGAALLAALALSEEHRLWRVARLALPAALGAALVLVWPRWDIHLMNIGSYFYADTINRIGLGRYLSMRRKLSIPFYREGPTGTVVVTGNDTAKMLRIDGRAEANTNAVAQVLLPHVPFAMGRHFRNALVVGMGSGSTAGGLTLHPLERIEVAEIDPAVIEASRLFKDINHSPLGNAKVHVRVADARTLLAARPPGSFDLILSQPSHPWVAGASKLFTREFYGLARSRLRPHGVFAQWMQLYNIDPDRMRVMLRTFLHEFPETMAFDAGVRSGEILLLGSTQPARISWSAIRKLYENPVVAADLNRVGKPTAAALVSALLAAPSDLRVIAGAGPLNTDDNSMLEFAMSSSLYRNTVVENLTVLHGTGIDPLVYLDGAPEASERQRLKTGMASACLLNFEFERGLRFATEATQLGPSVDAYRGLGDLLYITERPGEALEAWRKALHLEPEDQATLRRLIRHFRRIPERDRPPEFAAWLAKLPADSDLRRDEPRPLVVAFPSVASVL